CASDIIPGIMPGVEHMLEFHAVVEGSCWAAIVGESPVRLNAGDVVLFPQGDAHVMSSAPGMRMRKPDKDMLFTPHPPQLPFELSVRDDRATLARLDPGDRECTKLVCGFLGFDARPFNPLLASLPRVLVVSGDALGE